MTEAANIKKDSLIVRVERSVVVRAVRSGLINLIPVLIVGAFALILGSFPVKPYQEFIGSFAGGFLAKFFDLVNKATFGMLSVFMTLSISRSYMKLKADQDVPAFGAIVASLISFFVLTGVNLENFSIDSTNPKAMFLAILTGFGGSALYLLFFKVFNRRRRLLLSTGANREFNRMLSTLLPIALVTLIFASINLLVVSVFGVSSFRELLIRLFGKVFSVGEVGFLKGFFFVLLSSVLWFLGIHGSDMLQKGVMDVYFPAIGEGVAQDPILSKQFFDCFVLMGGCGATICLLIAILIFSRNKARRGLGVTAAFPMIFNINELMVFGLPIVFNPIMLIPFLLVPLVCYSTAYLATALGIVPVITNSVEWTTPIILGGYQATGSVAGALMQVFNVILGVAIYVPFIRLLDRRTNEESKRNFASFMDFFKKNEASLNTRKLTEMTDVNGEFAKGLCAELRQDVGKRRLVLAYQPQYNYAGECIGVEALLRWKHPTHGYIYPPLVVKLADDGGFLPELEEAIVRRVIADREAVQKRFGRNVKISFNVTGTTVVTDRFLQFLRQLDAKEPFKGRNLCVEITEQATLAFNDATREAFEAIRGMGLLLAIDDFSMGQTSLNYLKDSMFDIIKLDGSLIKGLSTHQNCREIISSIVQLSSTLNLTVIAEYVETEEERETLHEIGCDCYQGYLYSQALFLEESGERSDRR